MGSAVTTFGSKRFEVKISGQTGFHSVENTLKHAVWHLSTLRMPGGFRLGNDEGIVFARELAEEFRLLAGNIDRSFAGKLRMIQVQNFVVESLQGSLRNGDQPHRQV